MQPHQPRDLVLRVLVARTEGTWEERGDLPTTEKVRQQQQQQAFIEPSYPPKTILPIPDDMQPSPWPPGLPRYPAYCFSRSPTYNVWARLTAAEIHRLCSYQGYEGQCIYFVLNHPIRFVRLTGVVVARDDHQHLSIIQLDDGSGETIDVICPKPARGNPQSSKVELSDPSLKATVAAVKQDNEAPRPATGIRSPNHPDIAGVDVGTVVKVKGRLGEFRGALQVDMKRISIVKETNDEVVAWAEQTAFWMGTLSTPWTISTKEQEGLLKEIRRREERHRQKEEKRRHKRMSKEGTSRRKRDREHQAVGRRGEREQERKRRSDRHQERNLEKGKEVKGAWGVGTDGAEERRERKREASNDTALKERVLAMAGRRFSALGL
ncbi:MAG: hypothetical protein M1833_004440 [Piccolia ochrophora]|nr:MAG: hypothetical protein M1833_004440 [Piccolia ochrophora]